MDTTTIAIAVLNARIDSFKRRNPDYSLPPHFRTMAGELGAKIDYSGNVPVVRAAVAITHERAESLESVESSEESGNVSDEEIKHHAVVDFFEAVCAKSKGGLMNSRWA